MVLTVLQSCTKSFLKQNINVLYSDGVMPVVKVSVARNNDRSTGWLSSRVTRLGLFTWRLSGKAEEQLDCTWVTHLCAAVRKMSHRFKVNRDLGEGVVMPTCNWQIWAFPALCIGRSSSKITGSSQPKNELQNDHFSPHIQIIGSINKYI